MMGAEFRLVGGWIWQRQSPLVTSGCHRPIGATPGVNSGVDNVVISIHIATPGATPGVGVFGARREWSEGVMKISQHSVVHTVYIVHIVHTVYTVHTYVQYIQYTQYTQ